MAYIDAFLGQIAIHDYYVVLQDRIRLDLLRMTDDSILANDEGTLISHFLGVVPEPIERDMSRTLNAHEQRELRRLTGEFGDDYQGEVRYTILEYPLVPRESNSKSVTLRASTWPVERVEAKLQDNHIVVVRTYSSDIERQLKTIEQMIVHINRDIENYNASFPQHIERLVKQRISEVSVANRQFVERMRSLGIEVAKKPGAIEPVKVQVKKSIGLLREPPPRGQAQAEPHLSPESIEQIVGLIDTTGKGFEVTPSVYSKLGEEQLRSIIVGNLNAVFDSNVATGETFSKEGKSDILINTPGGAVLIAECKIWGGNQLYQETISQLFRYMAWRHTIGILITFSTRRGLTNVITEADAAIQSHPTYKANSLTLKNATYRISTHEHPDDGEKSIEVHHLFFNLFSGTTSKQVSNNIS